MKRETLFWLLILMMICEILSYSACEGALATQYKSVAKPKELCNNELIRVSKRRARALGEAREAYLKSTRKAGKGIVAGGANDNRSRKKRKNDAPSILMKSTSLFSATFPAVAGSLILLTIF